MIRPTAPSRLGRAYAYRPPPGASPLAGTVRRTQGADVDLRPCLRPVRDQLRRGTCFAHAGIALAELAHGCHVDLSPEYVAWRVQMAEWSFPRDAGGSVADTLGVLHSWGTCPEVLMPYATDQGAVGSAACDEAAREYRVGTPCRVDLTDLGDVRAVLAAGKGIAIGFAVYENFERTGRDGMVPPRLPSDRCLGGHAEVVVGVVSGRLVLRGSWGAGWGDRGYCYVDPAEFCQDVFESWTC